MNKKILKVKTFLNFFGTCKTVPCLSSSYYLTGMNYTASLLNYQKTRFKQRKYLPMNLDY